MDALQGTPEPGPAEFGPTVDIPAANRIGDYVLIRELGHGGFGVVYEAKHVTRGNRVALKTLPTSQDGQDGQDGQKINAEIIHRFRREFRSLAEFNHPNLVGIHTLEFDGDVLSYSCEACSRLARSKLGLSLLRFSSATLRLRQSAGVLQAFPVSHRAGRRERANGRLRFSRLAALQFRGFGTPACEPSWYAQELRGRKRVHVTHREARIAVNGHSV